MRVAQKLKKAFIHTSQIIFSPLQALESIRVVLSKQVSALRPIFEYYSTSSIIEHLDRSGKRVQLAIDKDRWEELLKVMSITDAGCNRLTQ